MDQLNKSDNGNLKMYQRWGKDFNEELAERCECIACPTYAECAREGKERLYCFLGNSHCITKGKGCICPSCRVFLEGGMDGTLFCLKGTDIVQKDIMYKVKGRL